MQSHARQLTKRGTFRNGQSYRDVNWEEGGPPSYALQPQPRAFVTKILTYAKSNVALPISGLEDFLAVYAVLNSPLVA